MPTTDTFATADIPIGQGKNDVSGELGPFKRAWNRLSSAWTPRHHKIGEDQIERGEQNSQATGTIQVVEGKHEEDAEAGDTPPDGPPAEAVKGQQHTSFSSTAFDHLPQPVPVVNVFLGSWWLVSAMRTASRAVIVYISVVLPWTSFLSLGFMTPLVLGIYLSRWALLKTGRDTIPGLGIPIPGKLRLFWGIFRWIQKIWVFHRLRFLNFPGRSRPVTGTYCSQNTAEQRQWIWTLDTLVVRLPTDYAYGGIQTELHGGMGTT